MDSYEFSHYEQCYSAGGWRWLKAWYVNDATGDRYWVEAD